MFTCNDQRFSIFGLPYYVLAIFWLAIIWLAIFLQWTIFTIIVLLLVLLYDMTYYTRMLFIIVKNVKYRKQVYFLFLSIVNGINKLSKNVFTQTTIQYTVYSYTISILLCFVRHFQKVYLQYIVDIKYAVISSRSSAMSSFESWLDSRNFIFCLIMGD